MKGLIHNSFFIRNCRKENLSSLIGMEQSTDIDMYNYEFGSNGQLKVIHTFKRENEQDNNNK